MKKCSPKNIIERYDDVKTFPTLFKEVEKSPTLLDIKLQYGKNYLESYLEIWVIRFISISGMECNISEDLMGETWYMAFEDYFHILTLADIKLFFEYAIKGKFNDRNNTATSFIKINGRTINDWVNKYMNLRFGSAEEESINEKSKFSFSTVRDSEIKSMRDMELNINTKKR